MRPSAVRDASSHEMAAFATVLRSAFECGGGIRKSERAFSKKRGVGRSNNPSVTSSRVLAGSGSDWFRLLTFAGLMPSAAISMKAQLPVVAFDCDDDVNIARTSA